MTYRILAGAAAFAALASGAQAVTTTIFVNDLNFNDKCNQGTSNTDCETAVGEFRGGGVTTYEQTIQTPMGPGLVTGSQDYTWQKGRANAFVFAYDATIGELSLTADAGAGNGGSKTSTYAISMGDVNSLFIRTRQGPGTVALSNLAINGTALGSLSPAGDGFANAGYLTVSDFDFTGDWSLTGEVTFDWTGATIPSQSRLNVNFKLTDIEAMAPIPLPAAAWLMIAGLGGLAAAGGRARRLNA